MLRPLRVLAVFALGCLAGCGTSLTTASSASTPAVSAMNGFSAQALPSDQRDLQLAAMQAQGVQVVRSDAAWATIEPQAPTPSGHSWQFSSYDAWVTQLAQHGITWEPIVDYAVGWAKTCSGFCPPDTDAPFAAFAQAVAARYGPGGSFWAQNPTVPYLPVRIFEIWNEENVSTFSVPAARYASLYTAARNAIDQVDPTASVDIGGLADDSQGFDIGHDYPWWFIQQLLQADPSIAGNVDAISLHPYGASATDVEEWVADFRHDLSLVGMGSVPIDISEVGWTTGDSTQEDWRASQMSRLALALGKSDCGIRLLAPYTWINPSTLNESGDFGLVDRSGSDTTLRPAGLAWFSGLQQAATLPQTDLCPGSDAASTDTAARAGGSSAGTAPSSVTEAVTPTMPTVTASAPGVTLTATPDPAAPDTDPTAPNSVTSMPAGVTPASGGSSTSPVRAEVSSDSTAASPSSLASSGSLASAARASKSVGKASSSSDHDAETTKASPGVKRPARRSRRRPRPVHKHQRHKSSRARR